LRTLAGVHLVVRSDRTGGDNHASSTPDSNKPDGAAGKSEIEMIVVSASRYEISRDLSGSRFQLDRRSIQTMPDVGDDPIRVTQRLPGAAAGGVSAEPHFRGGNTDEIGIMLNGHWLFDPFHVRDYQSIFSAIDSRAISGVEVYTGGFPARYGDRMSGVVLMESMEQQEPRHTEIGVSVFNTSFLTSGKEKNWRWLVSARRGNLDLVIHRKYGKPRYYDLFTELAVELSPDTTLSMNALIADDRVMFVLEPDAGELEQVVSRARNGQFWVQLESHWSDELVSKTLFSVTAYDKLRTGSTNDPETVISAVRDSRDVDELSLHQDWTWMPSERHFVQWGVQGTWGDAQYDYDGSAAFFGLSALYDGQPETVSRSAAASPQGGSFAVYASDRWRVTPRIAVEWGLRWDDQTYTELRSDAQLSPRLNFLYTPNDRTEWRLTLGRYYQSQRIHELQIEDGITNFWPAERSDHVIFGFRRRLKGHYSLRLEAFYKGMSRVRPRFENLFDRLGIIPEFQADRIFLRPQSARSMGLEISVARAAGSWDWWASYTLSKSTDRIDGRDQARNWDQRHAFQGGITWSSQKWTAGLAASVHSAWPTTGLGLEENGVDADGETVFLAVPGPRNALRLDTFASVDFRLSRDFDLKRGTLTTFVEVSNVLNRQNACCVDWAINDENAAGPVLERDFDHWLPLLPAVGVLWEF